MFDDAYQHIVYPKALDSKSTFDRALWNVFGYFRGQQQKVKIYFGVTSILTSLHRKFRIFKTENQGAIWVPNFQLLENGTESLQSPLGKELDKDGNKRPLIFNLGTTLPMVFWQTDDSKVYYFSRAEKKQFKIRITDTPYELKRNIDEHKIPAGEYIYVLSMHGGLIAIDSNTDLAKVYLEDDKQLRHSTMRAGQNVKAAGHINVNEDGVITSINSASGHYLTPDFNLVESALYLYAKEMINADCRIILRGENPYMGMNKQFTKEFTINMLLQDNSLRFESEDVQTLVDNFRAAGNKPEAPSFRFN